MDHAVIAKWCRYLHLDGRLTRVTRAFENAHISSQVGEMRAYSSSDEIGRR
jgi:hypothetical protein